MSVVEQILKSDRNSMGDMVMLTGYLPRFHTNIASVVKVLLLTIIATITMSLADKPWRIPVKTIRSSCRGQTRLEEIVDNVINYAGRQQEISDARSSALSDFVTHAKIRYVPMLENSHVNCSHLLQQTALLSDSTRL